MTEADNIKFSKHKDIKGVGYTKYDNYDAIEFPLTKAIPSDYSGVMGVPISFLNKYSPEQFEILGMAASSYDASIVGIPFCGDKKRQTISEQEKHLCSHFHQTQEEQRWKQRNKYVKR